jgi:hypothetical protein
VGGEGILYYEEARSRVARNAGRADRRRVLVRALTMEGGGSRKIDYGLARGPREAFFLSGGGGGQNKRYANG